MEILLNFAWASIALMMIALWLRSNSAAGKDRRRQVVAILVLIAILFPVISVSDDLLALQTATETDTYQRKDHLLPPSDHPLLDFAAIVLPAMVGVPPVAQGWSSLAGLPAPTIHRPERTSIDNRPPPAA